MPRPKTNKTPTNYPISEIDYNWQLVIEGMKKLRLEILSYEPKLHRGNTIMCALKEMQAKLELLNGKRTDCK